MSTLEKMDEFFAARLKGYDEHMLADVAGCRGGYARLAELVASRCGKRARILDLGCGTGLELERIFEALPDASVVCIDLSQAMLDALREKYIDRDVTAICGDYFTVPFDGGFDAAVSFQTMHHFSHEDKKRLYKKIYDSLKADGFYAECDYMVVNERDEAALYAENARLRAEQGITEGVYYHFDTPCTVKHQLDLLQSAGFAEVEALWRTENTTLIAASKI